MQTAVISFTETEFEAAIACAKSRLVIIAPGLSLRTARAVAAKWEELGSASVQVVLDLDPEACRLGYGEIAALAHLQDAAERLGAKISQQQGLRIGLVVTDETTTVFSPTPLLVEAGGKPGERSSAVRVSAALVSIGKREHDANLTSINLAPKPVEGADIESTREDLQTNSPMKFDLAQQVRVFNAKFEFVEFELRGLAISRKKVQIPSDLVGLAKDQSIQKLLQSSFRLIEEDSSLSGDRVNRLKQAIVRRYLKVLPGYGTVVLRGNKAAFERSVKVLKWYVARFQRTVEGNLQSTMDVNMEKLLAALLPSVLANQPKRWSGYGRNLNAKEVESLLRSELREAFGSASDLFEEMTVRTVYKGVTYELLGDAKFIDTARKALPHLELLHDEFDAARASSLSAVSNH